MDNLKNVSNTLESDIDTSMAGWCEHLLKTAHDKNIAIAEWNALVQRAALGDSNSKILVSAVKAIVETIGVESLTTGYTDIISQLNATEPKIVQLISEAIKDVVFKTPKPNESQEIHGEVGIEHLTVNNDASIGGNLVVKGKVSGKNITEMQTKLADTVLKNPQGGGTQDIKSALKATQIYTVGYANFGRDVNVTRDLSIGRNLYVKGTTYTVNQQTIIAKDNIIVTNAVSGAKNLASGLVINKGNDEAYGILYMPEGDAGNAVYIGEGALTVTKDKDGNVTNMEFEYDEDQALPLAARSAFGKTENGFVPVWDSDLNAFVPGNFGRENGEGFIEQFAIEHPTLDEGNEKYHPHFIATVGTVKDALGDISAALDELHAYAQSIYGGNG